MNEGDESSDRDPSALSKVQDNTLLTFQVLMLQVDEFGRLMELPMERF